MTKRPLHEWDELAGKRGLFEPTEEDHPIPFLLGLVIGLVLGWGATYAWFMPSWDTAMGRHFESTEVAAGSADDAGVDGAQVYMARCSACHQAAGTGVPGSFPPLKGSEWLDSPSSALAGVVLNGLMGPITVAGGDYAGMMPPMGGAMSDEEVAAVLGHLASEFGASGQVLDAAGVASVRAKLDGSGLIQGGEGLSQLAAE